MAKHEHTFTALWAHSGTYVYDSYEVHYHPCYDKRCSYVLQGKGRSCDGKRESHEVKKL